MGQPKAAPCPCFGPSLRVSDTFYPKVKSGGRLNKLQELEKQKKMKEKKRKITFQFTLCNFSIPLVKTKYICM